ncbi:hypothetical protein [Desulfobacter postgatei]|uniref:hypothetical protein n=1 Tax=Desulfobacter postgatei TaxID=2293 RepID=UPI00259B78D6|nr:hypothetical protein [uncultured Desulfobacter sp.]
MNGKCKLCGNEGELEESHFIPRFVGKWIKKTSITGYLREYNEPHKRAQDTAKEYWLCGKCEDKLSVWETKFAKAVFHPFVSGKSSVALYEDWMSKFCASLSWRTLTYIRFKNPKKDQTDEYYEMIGKAEHHLANYILGKVDNLNQYEQHLFPLDAIDSTTSPDLPSNINRYFLRTMAMDIVGNDTDLFIYTKMPCFMLLGVVECKAPGKLRQSRIALKQGEISPREYYWPDGFVNYIVEKANVVSSAYESIPQEQRDKIEQYVIDNPDKAVNSKLFEAFIHDYKMFGDDVFR